MRHLVSKRQRVPTVEYVYLLFIYLFIGMFGFTVRLAMVYGVNLFATSGMQHVVYLLQYKVFTSVFVTKGIILPHAR